VVWRRVRADILADGPRVGPLRVEGAAARVWLVLREPASAAEVRARSGDDAPIDLVDAGLSTLLDARLIEAVP
jgi:hypothetical protein